MVDIALPWFIVHPADHDPHPGVVVIHEAPGVSAQLLRFCQRLAGQGYHVLAPDLFFRVGGTESDAYPALVGSLDQARTTADVEACADALRDMGATSVGITGFCMGGSWAWHMAVASTAFAASAGFYGSTVAKELGTPTCPTTMFFGGSDPWIPMSEVEKVVAHHPDTVVYPEATHGFMRDGSPDYSPTAAPDAWDRMLALFRANLT
jgi:carboxymethylenebutenolidase